MGFVPEIKYLVSCILYLVFCLKKIIYILRLHEHLHVTSTSWLDHVVSTTTGHTLVQGAYVKSDFVSSDHIPLCFDIAIDKTNIVPLPRCAAVVTMMCQLLIGKI